MKQSPSQRWKAEISLLFVVCVWGLNFPLLKSVLLIMHPHLLNAFRFTLSIMVLGGIYLYQQRKSKVSAWQPLRDYPLPIIGLGILSYLIYQFAFIHGVALTTAGNAALIMASVPVWTALTGFVTGTERLGWGSWAALLTVVGGAALIIFGNGQSMHFGAETLPGNLTMLAAAICWGAYTALGKPVLRHVSATALTFFGLVIALPVLVGIGMLHVSDMNWSEMTFLDWATVVFSGSLASGLAFALWKNSVKQVGASYTAIYGNLIPIVALVSSCLMIGEAITIDQILGGTFVLGGLLLMRKARRKRTDRRG